MEDKKWLTVDFPRQDTLDGVLTELIRIFVELPPLMRTLGEEDWRLQGIVLSSEQPKGLVADALKMARVSKKVALYQGLENPDLDPEEGICMLLFAIAS